MGDKPSIERKITQLAIRQQGNVTRQQLLGAGLGVDAIDYRVKHGRLFPVHRGVYSVGRPPVTPHERAAAAVLACGPGAALSHGSAMTLWGFWKRWDSPFEVMTTLDRRPKGIRVHRARALHWRETRRHYGIRATSPARTLLDMAHRLNTAALRRAVKDGQAKKVLSLDALAETVARHPVHRNAARLRPFLDDQDDTRSPLEDRFRSFCRQEDLHPRYNALLLGFLIDALFEPEKVIVELDGWGFHSSRQSFEDDRERDGVTAAAGFTTLRITERGFAPQSRRLLEILDQRRPVHSPPS